jgi:uncharacterized protein YkwD
MARPAYAKRCDRRDPGSVLRTAAVAATFVALIVAAAAPAGVLASRGDAQQMASLEAGVLKQLNAIRGQYGLVPLKLNASLSSAAVSHSQEMGVDGYFEHNSYDGTAFWRRIGRWYPSNGYGYWTVGENLLWSSPDVDASRALDLWMHSPEHKANILAPRWREIGISAVHLTTAPGAYRGLSVTIVTTDFGARR